MKYPLEIYEKQIISVLKKIFSDHNITIKLEIPPENMGDFAFPCFSLAPLLKKSPIDIANDIAKSIQKNEYITKIEPKAGYVNFYINKTNLISETLRLILSMNKKYGTLQKKNIKIIIEHTSTNPNGPMHVGRARNPIIGDTLVRIFKASGYKVESQFYLDDMGKQVAILTWGVNHIDPNTLPKTENSKPDHFYVAFYQEANKRMQTNKQVEQEIRDIIKKLEHGDIKTIKTVHNAYKPVLEGINSSLHEINIYIDRYIAESTFIRDNSVNTIISKLKKSDYCFEEDGAYYLDLKSFGVQGRNTKFFLIRRDGTTLYATRDIAYHQWKAEQADLLLNILGEDHKLESKQVEIALKILGTAVIPEVLFYAFVSLPEGKMSTRRGRVVYLDDLIEECIERAYIEVKKRRGDDLSEKQMRSIAKIVGIGSLRYNIIKVQPEKDMIFKWEEALNFEGNAAPFIQYAHARSCSILSKVKETKKEFDPCLLVHNTEISLIKQLARYPLILKESHQSYKPHIMANYVYETASLFNQFYRDCPVIPEKNDMVRKTRITLVDATRIVLQNALDLLGIQAPEEM
ncbi:MAG: arginine--tRNA ligase [Thermoplasmatota archaeon]